MRRQKQCIKCGAVFFSPAGYPEKTICDECAAASKAGAVIRERVCVDCGAPFLGYPRSMRCSQCNYTHTRELKRIDNRKQREGKTRKRGSTDYCAKCGKPYIVNSGLQKYCPDCAEEAIKENDRAKSREWARKNFDYQQRQADRRNSATEVPCIICGKPFTPHNAAKTCSPECAAALRKQRSREYGIAHRLELEKAKRERNRAKLAAMSPEELTAYRERTNAKARENYRKRKDRDKNEKE